MRCVLRKRPNNGPVHLSYSPYFSACFFSRNSVFLSQQISQQCFSIQPNGADTSLQFTQFLSPYDLIYLLAISVLVHAGRLTAFSSLRPKSRTGPKQLNTLPIGMLSHLAIL
jgi:hypothetical protein